MIWSIPGTGFSGIIHLIAKRPYLLVIGLVFLTGLMIPAVPLLSTETLPPRVFHPPPPPTFVVAENIKPKAHRSASKLKRPPTASFIENGEFDEIRKMAASAVIH